MASDLMKTGYGVGVAALGALAIVAGVGWATTGVNTVLKEWNISIPSL